jgi:hypothetical protein
MRPPRRSPGRPRFVLRDHPDRLLYALFMVLKAGGMTERRAAVLITLFSECKEVLPEDDFVAKMATEKGTDGFVALGFEMIKARGHPLASALDRLEGRARTIRKKRPLSQADAAWLQNISAALLLVFSPILSPDQKKAAICYLIKRAREPRPLAMIARFSLLI